MRLVKHGCHKITRKSFGMQIIKSLTVFENIASKQQKQKVVVL